jgi:hypothetical protein
MLPDPAINRRATVLVSLRDEEPKSRPKRTLTFGESFTKSGIDLEVLLNPVISVFILATINYCSSVRKS